MPPVPNHAHTMLIPHCFTRTDGWVRLGRFGVSWTCGRAYFSERNGYRTPFLHVGKWRFFTLCK